MKKKGFTLIELLVVIAIIAMLLAILMPALGKVKKMAQRLVCGTNLKGMANAMNVYAFDYRDEFPVAGGEAPAGSPDIWAAITDDWDDPSKDWSGTDRVSVAASLYMLVREADVGPKSFICKGGNEQAFVNNTDDDMTELWDFGGDGEPDNQTPSKCQSYAYQIPYKMVFGSDTFNYPADGTSNPANAIMADRNPWYDEDMKKNGASGEDYLERVEEIDFELSDSSWEVRVGNSGSHDRTGQNILFGDGHVSFEKRPDVAARYDNVYTMRGGGTDDIDRRKGDAKSTIAGAAARNGEDSMLVNDEESQ